jgi:hypothetical protein
MWAAFLVELDHALGLRVVDGVNEYGWALLSSTCGNELADNFVATEDVVFQNGFCSVAANNFSTS